MAVKFITVHGTGDETRDARDPKWWQPESEFSQELLKRAGGGKIEPYIWDGENDELSRREAAEGLLWKLRDYEDNDDEVVLIGHSHGGSVIATALKLAMSTTRKFDNIKSIISVGTPFIGLKPQRWFWDRLNFAGQLGFLYSLFLFFLIVLAVATIFIFQVTAPDMTATVDEMKRMAVSDYTTEMMNVSVARDQVDTAYVTIVSSVFIIILTGYILIRSQRRVRELHDKKVLARFHDTFSSRWLALFDKRDEAINGLSRVYDLNLKLLQPAQTKELLRLILVFVAVFFMGSSVVAEQVFRLMTLRVPSSPNGN